MTNVIVNDVSVNVKNKCLEILEECSNNSPNGLYYILAEEILKGSNELAKDILGVYGFRGFEENGFCTYKEVAEFLGVSKQYLYGILTRYHISSLGKEDYSYGALISPRLMLALSTVMFYGRKIPKDSKAKYICEGITGTGYYKRAEEKWNKIKTKPEEVKDIVGKKFVADSSGHIYMSFEDLANIVSFFMNGKNVEKITEKNTGGFIRKTGRGSTRKRPVVAIKDGISKRYDSITECANAIGANTGDIVHVCQGTRGKYTVKGYSVAYA